MMKKKKTYIILWLIVLGAFFLVIGITFGIYYKSQKNDIQQQKMKDAFKVLSSEVVPSIVSYGKVTNIEGRKVTMAFNNDLITILIKEDAMISSLIGNGNPDVNQEKSDINKIKVGDMLNITVTVDENGEFQGDSVINFSEN